LLLARLQMTAAHSEDGVRFPLSAWR
jgi:hypothetical protein